MEGIGGPTGFTAWFQQFMFFAGPIVQIAYWVILAVAALWATIIFKRYVDFMTGAQKPAAPAKAETVSVEEFVE